MPNLLEIQIARRNPRLAGLLGVGTEPQPAEAGLLANDAPTAGRPGGFRGAVSDIFTGPSVPGLDPDEENRIRRSTLIQAGLAALASDSPGIQGLAEGALFGQAVGAQARAGAVEAQRREEINRARAEILRNRNLSTGEGRVGAVQDLLSVGLQEDAQKLINLMGAFEAPQVLDKGDRLRIFDPNTLEIMDTGIELPKPPGDTEWRQVGDRLELLDNQTGEVIAFRENPQRLSPSELLQLSKTQFEQANVLRDDFRAESSDIQTALDLAIAARNAPPNAAGGQTLVVAFNKLLDAGSVVREGEFQRVAEIGGLRARATKWMNEITKDGRLSAESIAQLQSEVARLERHLQSTLSRRADQFVNIAQQNNLNPNWVVRSDLQNLGSGQPSGGSLGAIGDFGG